MLASNLFLYMWNASSSPVHVNMADVLVCLSCLSPFYVGIFLSCLPTYGSVIKCLYLPPTRLNAHVFTFRVRVLQNQVQTYVLMDAPTCTNGMITLI